MANIPLTPPIMSRPIIDNLSSTISLARHELNCIDRREEKEVVNTATYELILTTFIKLFESKEWDKTQKPTAGAQKPFGEQRIFGGINGSTG